MIFASLQHPFRTRRHMELNRKLSSVVGYLLWNSMEMSKFMSRLKHVCLFSSLHQMIKQLNFDGVPVTFGKKLVKRLEGSRHTSFFSPFRVFVFEFDHSSPRYTLFALRRWARPKIHSVIKESPLEFAFRTVSPQISNSAAYVRVIRSCTLDEDRQCWGTPTCCSHY